MPELDFVQTQIRIEDTRTAGEKVRDAAVLGLVLSCGYALVLFGLVIEDVWFLIGYAAAVTAAA